MRIRTLIYSLREGIKGIYRNKMFTLASIGTMSACLFIFGLFFFLVSNFSHMIKSAESTMGISVFFEEGLSQSVKERIGNEIKDRKEVKEIKYISAAEAWEKYKKESLKPELIETFGDDNPLENSDSYTIYVKKAEEQNRLVNFINTLEGVRKVNCNTTVFASFSSINSLISIVSVTIIILLLGVAVFLISTTIAMGISVRKEEIFIMRMVGATDFFINAPFIVEGLIIGFIGAVLPLGVLFIIYGRAIKALSDKFNILVNILTFVDIKTEFSLLMPISIALGMGIGFIGSVVTLRRHINV